MGGVQFDEAPALESHVKKNSTTFTDFIIKAGLAKDGAGAEKILILLVVVIVIISGFIFNSAQKGMEITPAPAPVGFSE